jgi:hypothetical protein
MPGSVTGMTPLVEFFLAIPATVAGFFTAHPVAMAAIAGTTTALVWLGMMVARRWN